MNQEEFQKMVMDSVMEQREQVIVKPTTSATDSSESKTRTLPSKWYELDRFTAYGDLIMILGFLTLIAGIGLVHIPSAVIALGIGLVALSYLLSKARAL